MASHRWPLILPEKLREGCETMSSSVFPAFASKGTKYWVNRSDHLRMSLTVWMACICGITSGSVGGPDGTVRHRQAWSVALVWEHYESVTRRHTYPYYYVQRIREYGAKTIQYATASFWSCRS